MSNIISNGSACTIHHDYSKTIGDIFLRLTGNSPASAETKLNRLPGLAKFLNIIPFNKRTYPQLERLIKPNDKSLPVIMSSPVMMAAGGNKYARNLPAFRALGFGGIITGSATAGPSAGNPHSPRLQYLPLDRALNNSMGLNNPGIDAIVHAVDFSIGLCHKEKLSVGISIAESPGLSKNEEMISDILSTFRKAYRTADFVEINVSCPTISDNRIDWDEDFFKELLSEITHIRKSLVPRKAVFIKLSPDMSQTFLTKILQIISDCQVTGLTLFNTFPASRSQFLKMITSEREILPVTNDTQKGGISGRILYQNTLPAIKFIKKQLPELNILAVGGIDHGAKVFDALEAGADAVQCHTALAYRWNAVKKINKELLSTMAQKGYKSVNDICSPN